MTQSSIQPAWFMSYQRGRLLRGGNTVRTGSCISTDEHPIVKIERWSERAKQEAARDNLPVETFVLLWYRELSDGEMEAIRSAGIDPDSCDHELYA